MKREPYLKEEELKEAISVADFLGIPVPANANAYQISEAILEKIDALNSRIEQLQSANKLLSEKHGLATRQIRELIKEAKEIGITLTVPKNRPSKR